MKIKFRKRFLKFFQPNTKCEAGTLNEFQNLALKISQNLSWRVITSFILGSRDLSYVLLTLARWCPCSTRYTKSWHIVTGYDKAFKQISSFVRLNEVINCWPARIGSLDPCCSHDGSCMKRLVNLSWSLATGLWNVGTFVKKVKRCCVRSCLVWHGTWETIGIFENKQCERCLV